MVGRIWTTPRPLLRQHFGTLMPSEWRRPQQHLDRLWGSDLNLRVRESAPAPLLGLVFSVADLVERASSVLALVTLMSRGL